MSATLTYVYCLVRSTRPPSLRGVPGPMPGARSVRLLELPNTGFGHRAAGGGRKSKAQSPQLPLRDWLVVSSVPAPQYDEAALDRDLSRDQWVIPRALAHEAVVEHFLSRPAVLPMQLFTLFMSDDRAVAHMMGERRRIARILARVQGRLEWGLRVTVSRPEGSDPGSDSRPDPVIARSGAEYLARKRDIREAGRVAVERARRDADRVYRAVRRQAVAARRRTEVERAAPGSRVVLDAAFLVPTERRRLFQAFVRRQVRPLERAGIAVSLSGPWPAYNFI